MDNLPAKLTVDKSDFASITALIDKYFLGLHHGDVSVLKSIFHPDTWLKAPGSRRSLTQWLNDVKNRDTPLQLANPFRFKILAIDIVQDQAMVKVDCPLFNFRYVDFLGLLKEQGQWRIVTKMYTDIGDDKS